MNRMVQPWLADCSAAKRQFRGYGRLMDIAMFINMCFASALPLISCIRDQKAPSKPRSFVRNRGATHQYEWESRIIIPAEPARCRTLAATRE